MPVPLHLTIKTDGLPFESLLSDWRWLVQPKYAPILMTAFGDLFLKNNEGHIYFLDLMTGEFKQVALSQNEFDQLCDDKERRRSWFVGFLAMELRKGCGELLSGQCYGCKIPLSLGGQLEPENFERTDLLTHYSVLGQLHRQSKQLPSGTAIDISQVKSPNENIKPKSWWQRLANCVA